MTLNIITWKLNFSHSMIQVLPSHTQSFTPLSILVCQGCSHKAPQTEWLQWQKCFLSQLWRLEIQNQGGVRAMLPLKVLGKNRSQASVIPWLVGAWLQISLFVRTPAALRQGPTLLWSGPVLANYICDNFDSRYSPLLRCWGSGLQHAHLRGHSSAPNDAPKWWFRGLRLSLAALRSTESPQGDESQAFVDFRCRGPLEPVMRSHPPLKAIYGPQVCEHRNARVRERQSARQASTPT